MSFGLIKDAVESQALAVQMVRRHTRSTPDQEYHYGPAIRVVSGNYVTGRRRGVVGGVDFGSTGSGKPDCWVPALLSPTHMMACLDGPAPLHDIENALLACVSML